MSVVYFDTPVKFNADSEVLAKALADSGSDTQAKFLNEFFKELKDGCEKAAEKHKELPRRNKPAMGYEMQLSYISWELNYNALKSMESVVDFAKEPTE